MLMMLLHAGHGAVEGHPHGEILVAAALIVAAWWAVSRRFGRR